MALGEIFHWKTLRMSYLISHISSITEGSLKGYGTRKFIYYILNFLLDDLLSIIVLPYMNAFRYVNVVFWFLPQSSSRHVKNLALYMIAVVAPLVIMPLVNVVTVRSWWDFHNGLLYVFSCKRTLDVDYFFNLATLGGMLTHSYVLIGFGFNWWISCTVQRFLDYHWQVQSPKW